MKGFVARFAKNLPINSVSFAAKSTLVLASIVVAGRSFAGGTTSGVNPAVSNLTSEQLFVLKRIVEEKLHSDDIDEGQKIELEKINVNLARSLNFEEEKSE